MCAQFPMLSAPEPPEGGSPTPPPPTLPLRFTDVIGSADSAARTVPDDFLTSARTDKITGNMSGNTIQNGHSQLEHPTHQLVNGDAGPSEPELHRDPSDRQHKHSRHSNILNRTSSSGSKSSRVSMDTVDHPNGVNGVLDRPDPSDPIPIRTGMD